jgi:hypothetical protein
MMFGSFPGFRADLPSLDDHREKGGGLITPILCYEALSGRQNFVYALRFRKGPSKSDNSAYEKQ